MILPKRIVFGTGGAPIEYAPVVRCKDCQYARYNPCNETWRCVSYSGMMRRVDENDFCSYGERREEDG